MVAGWRGWANLSRPGGVLLTVQELSNPRPRRSLDRCLPRVYSGGLPESRLLLRAILILLSSTFDTRNLEIIEVVAVVPLQLCVKYVGDVGVPPLAFARPRENESNFPRERRGEARRARFSGRFARRATSLPRPRLIIVSHLRDFSPAAPRSFSRCAFRKLHARTSVRS